MMSTPKPQSIEDVGLEKHIDSTAASHHSLAYHHFVSMVGDNPDKPKVDKSNMARAFNVNRATISRWIEIYKKEQGITTHVEK